MTKMETALVEIIVYPDGLIVNQKRVQIKLAAEDLAALAKERGFVGPEAIANWVKSAAEIDLECIS